MSNNQLSLLLALGATLSFASASLIYAEYAKRVSVLWMNCFKATIAFIALAITIPLSVGWQSPTAYSLAAFLFSGLIGLNIGDLFLLSAFTRLGVGRTLILFGFQPLFVGIAAYFFFGQELNPLRFLAVIFLIGCLVTFSLERYRIEKRWEASGLIHALIGVLLDTCGVLLSRSAFADSPQITPVESHFYRCAGALLGFAVISYFYRPIHLIEKFKGWNLKTRTVLIGASLTGTYLSLLLYLSAVKIGHLASIASIGITGPIFATLLESIYHRKAPSVYLWVALGFFAAGFSILAIIS